MTQHYLELPRCYSRADARLRGDLTYMGNSCRKNYAHGHIRVTSNGGCADCQTTKVSDGAKWKRIALPRPISLAERSQLNKLSVEGTIGMMLLDLLTLIPGDTK